MSLSSLDPTNKYNQALDNQNNNNCSNDNIDNKKIPHKPHKPVISFLGYKHNSHEEPIISRGSRNPQDKVNWSLKKLLIKYASLTNTYTSYLTHVDVS